MSLRVRVARTCQPVPGRAGPWRGYILRLTATLPDRPIPTHVWRGISPYLARTLNPGCLPGLDNTPGGAQKYRRSRIIVSCINACYIIVPCPEMSGMARAAGLAMARDDTIYAAQSTISAWSAPLCAVVPPWVPQPASQLSEQNPHRGEHEGTLFSSRARVSKGDQGGQNTARSRERALPAYSYTCQLVLCHSNVGHIRDHGARKLPSVEQQHQPGVEGQRLTHGKHIAPGWSNAAALVW